MMQVDPQADDSVWHYVITRILSASYDTYDSLGAAPGHKQMPLELPPAELRLSHNVWIDLQRCVLVSPPDIIPLTGREMRVLRVLTQHLGRFLTAIELARQVADSLADPIDGHCIEQTISGLRRKLGESAETQHILVSRRGLGYALVADKQEGAIVTQGNAETTQLAELTTALRRRRGADALSHETDSITPARCAERARRELPSAQQSQ